MDLATVDQLLTTTRSVRKRLDLTRPVESAVIAQCLDIAMQAPTGANIAWYHFVVVTDPVTRAGLATLYRQAFFAYWTPQRQEAARQTEPRGFASYLYLADHLHEVPVHIIPCVEDAVEQAGAFQLATRYGCILPAAWSLMLALVPGQPPPCTPGTVCLIVCEATGVLPGLRRTGQQPRPRPGVLCGNARVAVWAEPPWRPEDDVASVWADEGGVPAAAAQDRERVGREPDMAPGTWSNGDQLCWGADGDR